MREARYIRRLVKIRRLGRAGGPVSSMLNPQDLQRLIDIITEEVVAAQGTPRRAVPLRLPLPSSTTAAPTGCAAVVDAGATRLGVHAAGGAPAGVATMIDHTLLKPDATRADIEKLCREAAEFHFATVCVNPVWVAESRPAAARQRRRGLLGRRVSARRDQQPTSSTTRPAAPSSTAPREIDMVINVGALKSGDLRTVERDIEAVVEPCRQCGVDQQGHHRGRAAHRRRKDRRRARCRRRPVRIS